MKILVILALAALAAAEAEPEADPQLLLNAGHALASYSPLISVKAEEGKPITYTVPSAATPYASFGAPIAGAYPYASWPYMQGHYNTWPYLLPQVGQPAESARSKREADPQLLLNTALQPWATPYTAAGIPYAAAGVPYTAAGIPYAAATPYAFGAPFAAAGAYPYAYNPLVSSTPIISTPGSIRTISTTVVGEAATTEAAARKKREAEADPQFFMNPLVSFNADDTPLPLTYSFPTVSGVPAVSPITYGAGALPITYSGASWSAAWSHPGLPIAYTLAAKKTE